MSKYVPLRKFIYDRLYHSQAGYFCKPDFQVGELSQPIKFKQLIGFDDYQKQLYQRYPKNAWLTPCQIFKPYYGMTIGNYINTAHEIHCKKQDKNEPIRIVEAGAGTGSAAQSILYYFQNFQQKQFQNLQYNIVQISPSLCRHMQKKLRKSYPRLFQNKQIKIINQDISNYTNEKHLYMLFFEVLDNLPHDKIIWNEKEKRFDKFTMVNMETKEQKEQLIQKDLLIKQCSQLYEKRKKMNQIIDKQKFNVITWLAQKFIEKTYKAKGGRDDVFIPTFLYTLLKNLHQKVPNSHLIISDFDDLISQIEGVNAPIVSKKGEKSHDKEDYQTYLVDRGEADIFFPVDFHFLRVMHKEFLKRDAHIVKTYNFMDEFSLQNWTTSKSGFNPIKQDFKNTAFLTSKI